MTQVEFLNINNRIIAFNRDEVIKSIMLSLLSKIPFYLLKHLEYLPNQLNEHELNET